MDHVRRRRVRELLHDADGLAQDDLDGPRVGGGHLVGHHEARAEVDAHGYLDRLPVREQEVARLGDQHAGRLDARLHRGRCGPARGGRLSQASQRHNRVEVVRDDLHARAEDEALQAADVRLRGHTRAGLVP